VTTPHRIRQALTEPKSLYQLAADTGIRIETVNRHVGEMLEAGELREVYENEMVKLEVTDDDINP
jgi:hypothetical protein